MQIMFQFNNFNHKNKILSYDLDHLAINIEN